MRQVVNISDRKARFAALDGWRGIAACGVAAFHFGVINHFYSLPFLRTGSPYVDFFFVLSGFVIAHTYANRVHSLRDAGFFMVRRFGRLWPLHLFTLACLILLETAKLAVMASTGLSAGEAPFTGSSAALAIPAHLVLLQAVGLFHDHTWNVPSWSIGCEFWTYAMFAGACLSGAANRRVLSGIFIAAGAAILVVANGGSLNATYDLGMFRCLIGFFAGVLTYEMFLRVRCQLGSLATAVEAFIFLLVVVVICTLTRLVDINPLLSFLPAIVFPVAILIFAQEQGRLSSWLLKAPLQSLGRWSYSIYMVHFIVITVMNSGLRILDKLQGTNFSVKDAVYGEPNFLMNPWIGDGVFALYFAVVIGLAALSWRYIEEPFRVYFNNLARKHETAAATTAPTTA